MIERAIIVVILVLSGVAHAQSAASPALPYLYSPPRPQLPLSVEELETLSIGYISNGQYIGGGLASLFLGFGIGQAVEGRWHDTGWIFTLGEPAAVGVVFYGLVQLGSGCVGDPHCGFSSDKGWATFAVGAIGLVGLRLWEVIDALVAPPRHNERFRAVEMKLGNPRPFYGARPFVAPAASGAIAGLVLRF